MRIINGYLKYLGASLLLLFIFTPFIWSADTAVSPPHNIPPISAHRGGITYHGYPENCLETFEYVLNHIEAMIEFDVSMTKDSVLVLMHDKTIDRTTTGEGTINELNWKYIEPLQLIDNYGDTTNLTVPTFEKTLQWAKENQVVMSVDVKRGVPFDLVLALIDRYDVEELAIVITYSIADAEIVQLLNPNVKISVSVRNEKELEALTNSTLNYEKLIAFIGLENPSNHILSWLERYNIPRIIGTLGTLDKLAADSNDNSMYQNFIRNGMDVLATDRPIEASRAIAPLTSK